MIVILEGPDGSGKTHLAKQMAKQSNYPLIHRVAPESQRDKDLMFQSYLDEINRGKNMVFDRAWYSDMVYGPIFRGETPISFPRMYALEERLARAGAIIIYCTGHPNTLWARCHVRGEDNPGGTQFEQERDKFDRVCHDYDRLMRIPHHIPVVRYEYKEV
jgi:thymidylate kinase